MSSITFSKFKLDRNSFSCDVLASDRDHSDNIQFMWNNDKLTVDPDSIALALTTLCGTKYSTISFNDLVISKKCAQSIFEFTNAKVIANIIEDDIEFDIEKDGYILNFSGGFDSLAALALLSGNKINLVSIDFGGWFKGEENFFKRFNPITLKTNFRELKYDRATWTFMGFAAILFAKSLNAKYNVFGTILEATPKQIKSNSDATTSIETKPFCNAGLKDAKIVAGLSQMGTAMIALKQFPDKIIDSLNSLAGEGSIKSYRKHQLLKLASKRMGINIKIPECNALKQKPHSFGESFGEDFLLLYELKHLGKDIVNNIVSNIPNEAYQLSEKMSLNFYERFNTNYLNVVPGEFRAQYIAKLIQNYIIPYTEKDWNEFSTIRNFLGKYYQ